MTEYVKKAVVLLSGGLDSAVCLHMFKDKTVLAIGFEYGQKHNIELGYADGIAESVSVPFRRVKICDLKKVDDVVYAARNAMMIVHATGIAQEIGADTVVIGCNMDDAERFPDCRGLFLSQISGAMKWGYNVNVYAPLLSKPKSAIAKLARRYKIDPNTTWSCYDPQDMKPCGECLACQIRQKAIE